MRPLSVIIGFLMIASCYAVQIVKIENYWADTQATIAEESLKLKESLDARLPIKSKRSLVAARSNLQRQSNLRAATGGN